MKIKIIKCDFSRVMWYRDLIGKCFNTELNYTNDKTFYYVLINNQYKPIYKIHCINVTEDRLKKLNSIINDC